MAPADSKACTVRLAGGTQDLVPWSDLVDTGYSTTGPECQTPDPDDHTLVLATVVAFARTVSAPSFALPGSLPDPFAPDTLATAHPVKMRVSSSQWRGPVWTDTGRAIVVPSPHACVGIIAPEGWRLDPQPGQLIPRAGEAGAWIFWDVRIFLKICRAPCCPTGLPILTDAQSLASGAVPSTFIVPRGARRVHFSGGPTGQLQTATWFAGPNAPTGIIGTHQWGTDGLAVDVVPDANLVTISTDGESGTPMFAAWEVQP